MGRWLNRDPLEELGSKLLRREKKKGGVNLSDLNLYTFALNNPVQFVDYYGLEVYICKAKLEDYKHTWLCVDNACAGLYPKSILLGFIGFGEVKRNHYIQKFCSKINVPTCCQEEFENCIKEEAINRVGSYNYYQFPTYTCGNWAYDKISRCYAKACSEYE